MSVTRRSDASPLRGTYRALTILVIVASLAGFFLALWTGGLVAALHELLAAIGLARQGEAPSYPLGPWILLVYVVGGALALVARQRPFGAGVAMVLLAALAFLYGGPVARVYGLVLFLAGTAFVVIHLRLTSGKPGRIAAK